MHNSLRRQLTYLFRMQKAQRLAAQPLGHFRNLVTILAGNPKSQSSIHSLSLGQVGCSRVLGGFFI
jgi:hypothetical protein